jgi:metallophosphoesterase (TIGR00282 family)
VPERPGAGIVRVLMIGDVIGKPGRQALDALLPELRDRRGIDLVTANGENLAGGMGLTPSTAQTLYDAGVDVITSGNHIWDKKEIIPELDKDERILRPLNYGQEGVPGRGWGIFHAVDGTEIVVISAQGRTYMQPIENPFTDVARLLEDGADELPPVRLVDFHCEVSSEKTAFGLHLDGLVSAVVGTHTHVPTADLRILPRGTGFVCDLGMTGPVDSVIGFAPETVLPRFLTGLPTRFEVGSGPVVFHALLIDVAPAQGGRAVAVERISRMVDV